MYSSDTSASRLRESLFSCIGQKRVSAEKRRSGGGVEEGGAKLSRVAVGE